MILLLLMVVGYSAGTVVLNLDGWGSNWRTGGCSSVSCNTIFPVICCEERGTFW